MPARASAADPDILQTLLQDFPASAFRYEFYLRRPYSRALSASEFMGLLAWDSLDRVLRAMADADASTVADGALVEGVPHSAAEARALFGQGKSFVVRGAERLAPELRALADRFEETLVGRCAIQIFGTPAGQRGFGWHYDVEEVFLLQCRGVKRYRLRENAVHPAPRLETMRRDLQYEQETSGVLECTLQPGDWLYIPAGWWHVAQAVEDSLALSVGISPPVAIDLLDAIRPQLLLERCWRQRIPEEPADRESLLGELEASFGRWLRSVPVEFLFRAPVIRPGCAPSPTADDRRSGE